jgi:hypothetical protein
LEIVITGLDAWLMDVRRTSVRVTVPLDQVTGVDVDSRIGVGARSTHELSQRQGWLVCARRRGQVLKIEADGHPWRAIKLSVPDPDDMAATIKTAMRRRER